MVGDRDRDVALSRLAGTRHMVSDPRVQVSGMVVTVIGHGGLVATYDLHDDAACVEALNTADAIDGVVVVLPLLYDARPTTTEGASG